MKVLLCHNYYQLPGGEDRVFADETALLESRGHEVLRFTRHNDSIEGMNRLKLVSGVLFNRETYQELRELIRRERPQIMHVTNAFPLISPSAYAAAKDEGTAVVQSLHNFRLLCPNSTFLRNGAPCEDCLTKKFAWPGVVHGCYRDSMAASATVAALSALHRRRGTWRTQVDRYVCLSEFARRKFVAGGLPDERLAVKPNFVDPDPGPGDGGGAYALFVGRLSEEKGIETMLGAWTKLRGDVRLKIVGDGPLASLVRAAAAKDRRIEWLGHAPHEQVASLMGPAACLLLPSICYENCPKTLIEAFSRGTPVIASRLGAMREYVTHETNGLHFAAGDAADLASVVERFFADAGLMRRLRTAARSEYETKFTADENYRQLMETYRLALITAGVASSQSLLPDRGTARQLV